VGTTTITFQGYKGQAPYTCSCSGCAKVLKRIATVEHTVNPFNKNEAGEVKSPAEVRASAQAAAEAEARKLEGVPQLCRSCEDAPNRALLLSMAAHPHKVFPEPQRYWNSPMHYLEDRKQVEGLFDSEWNRIGYRITPAGLKRAAQHSGAER
jgi:hypothetical protein